MELQSSPLYVTLFLTFLFLSMVVRIVKRTKTNQHKVKLPPGPWKLPVVGNRHQLISPLPHRKFRDLAKKYGGLMHLQLGEVPTVVVSSAKNCQRGTNDITFSQRPNFLALKVTSYDSKGIVFARHGNYWRQLRKICTMELLSPNRVQSFQSIRAREVSDLIKFIASKEKSPINLSEKIFSLSYGITTRAALNTLLFFVGYLNKKIQQKEEFKVQI